MATESVRVSGVAGFKEISLTLSKDRDRDNPFARLSPAAARMLAQALLAAAEFNGDESAYQGMGDGFDFYVDATVHGWDWDE